MTSTLAGVLVGRERSIPGSRPGGLLSRPRLFCTGDSPSRKVSSPRPSSVLLVHHCTSGDWLHHEGNDLRGEGSGQEGPCSVLSTFRQWSHRAGYTVHALSIKGLGAQCARRGCPRPVWKRILTGTYVDDANPPEEGRWLPAQARPHPSDLSPPT